MIRFVPVTQPLKSTEKKHFKGIVKEKLKGVWAETRESQGLNDIYIRLLSDVPVSRYTWPVYCTAIGGSFCDVIPDCTDYT